ncbi:MAG: hypothetical protein OEV61_11620, partial [Chloroflexota bacterium]|nr:hypothetical protein [Chloroflexota bacterium]
ASFYIGAVVLGMSGPLVLAEWAAAVASRSWSPADWRAVEPDSRAAVTVALWLALAGLLVAVVESRNLAVALLGAQMSGRGLTWRQALVRSRRVFWLALAAAIVVSIPLAIAQTVVGATLAPVMGLSVEAAIVTTVLVASIVGAPFAYVLSGVVLGDVGPIEAIRRSWWVFRARKVAAVIVAGFDSLAVLLVLVGLSIGLEMTTRVIGLLGLGPDSGPLGLAVMTVVVAGAIYSFGTLLLTTLAIAVAPQVVMFVGLTHATMGLDHVRSGGRSDPNVPAGPGTSPFRMFTRPMLAAFGLGAVLLAAAVIAPGR